MKQEDKDLLLRDLCGRLPYGIKCSFGVDDAIYVIEGINPNCYGASEIQATHLKSSINGDFKINSCKPYLFPLSSMTEEQKEEYGKCYDIDLINGTKNLYDRLDGKMYSMGILCIIILIGSTKTTSIIEDLLKKV